MSTSSRFSVNAASGIAPNPLVLESRPNIDLSGSRQQMDLARSRPAFAASVAAGLRWYNGGG